MKVQLLVAITFATWLVLGISDELSAQQMPAVEVQVVQDAGDAAKDDDGEEKDGEDEKKKKGGDEEDKKGKSDDDDDEKGGKGHKGKGKGKGADGGPVIIINIYINGEAVVGGHGKSKD